MANIIALRDKPTYKPQLPKLVFIVDIRGWAFDTIAGSLARRLNNFFNIETLYWEDYPDHTKLIDLIIKRKYDHVHFFFREHLKLILDSSSLKPGSIKEFSEITTTTHIPDYLYASQMELASRVNLFEYVDGYFTTNSDLFRLYCGERLIPQPDTVIFDWPQFDIEPARPTDRKKPIKIAWSGNSEWGSYAGHVDYKGLNNIVLPAIRELKMLFPDIEFLCFDSAQKKVPHSDILDALRHTDILVIASEAEGTPLTLIEGIAFGCAIVSTDVGIAKEILDSDQHRYIVERTPEAMLAALSNLVMDPVALQKAKHANYDAYIRNFGPDSPLTDKWVSFLREAQQHKINTGVQRKTTAIFHTRSRARTIATLVARRGAHLVKRWGLVNALNNTSPVFARTYNKLIHQDNQSKSVSYDKIAYIYRETVELANAQAPIVVYAPIWKGVAASTESLFQTNLIRFPYLESEYPEVTQHGFTDTLAQLLGKGKAPIIYSGGSIIHLELAKKVRLVNKHAKQYFLWHGSPAQWVEHSHLSHFVLWQTAYKDGVIDGIISLKRGLDQTLQNMGINSISMCNRIPSLTYTRRASAVSTTVCNIGVFSALDSWYKNPYVQLLALAGKEQVCLHTNIEEQNIRSLALGLADIKHYSHMPRPRFLSVMSSLDLNLYVSNTECSPMIALESWSMGIPCIVGPAGDVFSSISDKLSQYLVEPYVDSPNAISDRVDLVLENRIEIQSLLTDNVALYNRQADRYIDCLYEFLGNPSEKNNRKMV